MKLLTPDIVYHNIEPIYTCDIQTKSSDFIRLATGGFDCAVRLWKLSCTYNSVKDFRPVELLATLNRHEKRVNVVRWSPSGNILASASDDGVIILWQKNKDYSVETMDNDDEGNLESWTPRCLRRHFQDVYDLCWSMNENHLISGSIDCCAILWNLKNINKVIILKDHKHFVQGVAWDPLDNVVITQSSDRTMRVYRASTRTCIYKVWKSGDSRLFQDGSWKYFFRRLEFSPDGKLLVTPAGCYDMKKNPDDSANDLYTSGNVNDNHAAHIFVRHNLSKVAVTIPTGKHAVIGVRFNPVRFTLNNKSADSVFKLPYRWIFCLILDDGVLIYDTEQCVPIAKIFNIHIVSINDATWSPGGNCLVVSSTDGFCSFIYFEKGELGEPYLLVSQTSLSETHNRDQPLKTIENLIESDEDRQSIATNNKLNLPILELDPTEIMRATSSTTTTGTGVNPDENGHSNSNHTDINSDVHMEIQEVPNHPQGHEPPSKQTDVREKFLPPARSSIDSSEPERKKRRLTLTTLQ